MEEPEVLAARARAEASKQRLMATVEEAKYRLAPSTIANNAVDGVKARANEVAVDIRAKAEDVAVDLIVRAEGGIDTARRNPVPVAVGAAVLALFFLRKPLLGLILGRKPALEMSSEIAETMLPELIAQDSNAPTLATNVPA